MKRRRKQWLVAIAALMVVVLVLVGLKAAQISTMGKAGGSFSQPPEVVTSAKVEASEWESTTEAIGSLVAVQGVVLAAELPGTVREISFESGASVKRGAVLVKLDTSTENALLASAQAGASLAKLSYERAKKLRESNATTQAELETARARLTEAEAAVANLRATIAKKVIRAPFDGRVAIRQVELGQVLGPGTPITSLNSVTPIYADFWLPQQALATLQAGQRVRVRTDTFPDSEWRGEISTVNPEVDPTTRNVRVRATVPNEDGRLRPGMFVNVEVLGARKQPVLVIPATAIVFAPYGDSVFAIEEKADDSGKQSLVARQTFIRTGERRGDFVAVVSGLKAGEQVVSSGAFKLRNGAAITVDNRLAPEARLAPKPSEE
ncbi:MAG TPA: efflux RND transporter periplasmic adaptor subunit [Myxococcaceae bacterium]|nr:efflux RND transporter periplasmic adaptor subunit [Myxococcaceae bacterium]